MEGGEQGQLKKWNAQEDWASDSTDDEHAQWVNISRILKIIPRDNPNDPFKQHSVHAINILSEGEPREPSLLKDEDEMLQNFGADLDLCTPFDRTDPPGAKISNISKESRAELQKMPPWLRTFIETKFETIHSKYQYHTHVFLQMLASRVQYRKMKYWSLLSETAEDESAFVQTAEDHDDETEALLEAEMMKAEDKRKDVNTLKLDPFRQTDYIQVEEEDQDPDIWSPLLMQRAADSLRACLLAGASDSEGEGHAGDDKEEGHASLAEIRDKRRKMIDHTEDDFDYKGPHWEDVVAEREHFREKAAWEVEMEFTPKDKKHEFFMRSCLLVKPEQDQEKLEKEHDKHKHAKISGNHKKSDKKTERKKRKSHKKDSKKQDEHEHLEAVAKLKEQIAEEDLEEPKGKQGSCCGNTEKSQYYSYYPGHPLYRKPKALIRRKARLFRERGVGKRPSRIYVKDPCKGPITRVIRELHQPRPMEGFHAYINFIVASAYFRYFIMAIILFNAVLLAAETGERKERFRKMFNMLDSVFLSVYFVEFLVKMYSNPIHYFQSGFNLFDFVILIVSFVKVIAEWQSGSDIPALKFMIIVRALRILRGVSLSVHIQVLVKALVETLKNHVLSVVILLVLLMYIASIVAFYFFAEEPALANSWSKVPRGMLRLFSFVTMDGWTEVLEEFEEAGMIHEGRFFCLICIVLGNFLFSNIFIAIIIMQISEATDSFRKSQAEERESSVFLKQEAVYRRQKLDMRQLLARQKLGVADDFYELGSKFVRRLRHDDLVDNRHVIFSPLWMDSLYKGMKRTHHTSNILMTLHRKMADRLLKLNNLYDQRKYTTRGISRSRYNRYVETKAKLRVLKEMFVDLRKVEPRAPLKVRLPQLVTTTSHALPPPKPPPMPSRKFPKSHKANPPK